MEGNCKDHSMVLSRLEALEQGLKEVFGRLIVVEKNDSKFEQEIEGIGNNISDIKTDIKEMKDDLKAEIKEMKDEFKKIKELPSKRWETFKTIVITAVVTLVVGFVGSKILGK